MKSSTQKALNAFLNKFDDICKEISSINWKASLIRSSKQFQIKCYKIQYLSPPKVRQIYESLVERYYLDESSLENCWHENELRVFVWMLLTWSDALNSKPQFFTTKQWNRLSEIFNNKPVKLLEFQYQNLKRLKVRVQKWSDQEDDTLKSIIGKWNNSKISWNQVSKEMYYSTNQKIFRPPKQCRERWNNYLDPGKSRGEWSLEEDQKLIEYVMKHGKRWAMIGKYLEDKRTEHMVKNRYNSLLSRFKKQNPSKKQMTQKNLIEEIYKNVLSKESSEGKKPNEKRKKMMKDQEISINEQQQQEQNDQEQQQSQQEKQKKTIQLQDRKKMQSSQFLPETILQTRQSQQKIDRFKNFTQPTPLPLFQKGSQNQSNPYGSPRFGITPGQGFLSMTPFLISPDASSAWQGNDNGGNVNLFSFDNIAGNKK